MKSACLKAEDPKMLIYDPHLLPLQQNTPQKFWFAMDLLILGFTPI